MCSLIGGRDVQPTNINDGSGQLNLGLHLGGLGGVHDQLGLAANQFDLELVTVHLGYLEECLELGKRPSQQGNIISQSNSTFLLSDKSI